MWLASILFFLSGLASLGYQLVWSRQFGLALGTEMVSVLAVVSGFLGGMAFGSWLLDKPISRSRFPSRWYAGLEAVIGLWAILSSLLLPKVQDRALHWIGLEPSFLRQWSIAFLCPFLTLLPATAAMGATFIAMDRWVAPWLKGRAIGGIYAANTAGAVCGTLLSTFLVVPQVGFANAVFIFAGLSLFCAMGAACLPLPRKPREGPQAQSRRRPSFPLPEGPQGKYVFSVKEITRAVWRVIQRFVPPHPDPLPRGEGETGSSLRDNAEFPGLPSRRIVLTLVITGFLGIGFESVAIRVLSQILEGTVFTFAVVLSAYLAGTTLGGAIYQRLLKERPATQLLNTLLSCVSSACLLGTLILSQSQAIYDFLRESCGDTPLGVFWAELLMALAVFGTPTLCMGAVFSHLVQQSRGPHSGVGSAAAANIFGGAIAPFICGVLLVPWLGSKWTLCVIGLSYLALPSSIRPFRWWRLSPLLCLLILIPVDLRLVQFPAGTTLAAYREGVAASVAVLEDNQHHRTLRVNNRFQMGGTAAALAEYRHAHFPLLLHPNPKRALFLGLGTGISLAGSTFYPDLISDGVELLPEVVSMLPQFEPFNKNAGQNPRLPVFVADARRFVRVSIEKYDVVVADLFHPALDGAGALYTVEHFRAIQDRLSPGGIFCQWLPMHQLDEEMIQTVGKNFLEVFPHAAAFLLRFNADAPVLGLIGFKDEVHFTPDWIERRVITPELKEQLHEQVLGDSVRFFGCLLAGADELRAYTANAPINTDASPRVMFRAPRFSYLKHANSYGRLVRFLEQVRADPKTALGLGPGSESDLFAGRLRDYFRARDVYLNGLVAETEGRPAQAVKDFVESARLSADFTPGYAKAITIASLLAKEKPAESKALLRSLAAAQPERPLARETLKRLFGEDLGDR